MTLTLPRIAADLDGNGHSWFAFQSVIGDGILWCAAPTLPDATFTWALDVDTPHLTLDLTAVAELLYSSQLDPGDDIDTDALAALVLAQVDRWHCDLAGPIAALAQDAGDHPEACARRMTWCVCAAARLLGTVV